MYFPCRTAAYIVDSEREMYLIHPPVSFFFDSLNSKLLHQVNYTVGDDLELDLVMIN